MSSVHFSHFQEARNYFDSKDNRTIAKLGRGLQALAVMRENKLCTQEEFLSLKPRDLVKAVSQTAKKAELYDGKLDKVIKPLKERIVKLVEGNNLRGLKEREKEPIDSLLEKTLKVLDIQVDTKTIKGFQDDELYTVLNISLPAQKEKSSPPPIVELVFCIDKSGSMEGNSIQNVKNVLLGILEKAEKQLSLENPSDISLSVVVFDHNPSCLLSKQKIALNNIEFLKNTVSSLSADGGTCIIAAIEKATEELREQHNPKAATNLIFLTDGQDKDFYQNESQVSRLQDIWVTNYTNLLAIGIGEEHDARILQRIITDVASGRFLPNATYSYIPHCNQPGANGITPLENVVNLIYRQAEDQAIQSIELSIGDRDVQVLNTQSNASGQFLLGGLSYGQTVKKVLRYKASNPQAQSPIPYTISVTTMDDRKEIKGTFSVSPNNPDATEKKAILIQELLSTLELMQEVLFEGVDFIKIITRRNKQGRSGYKNAKEAVQMLLAEDPEKWRPILVSPPSGEELNKHSLAYEAKAKAKGQQMLEKVKQMIQEYALEEDDDVNSLLDELNRVYENIFNSKDSSEDLNLANTLSTTSKLSTTRSFYYDEKLNQAIQPLKEKIEKQIPEVKKIDLSVQMDPLKGKEPDTIGSISPEKQEEPEMFRGKIEIMQKNLEKAFNEHRNRAQSDEEKNVFFSPLDTPIDFSEKSPLQFRNDVHEEQSVRSTMEDEHFYKELDAGVLIGVLDGHGGDKVSKQASALLQENFQRIFNEKKGDVHETFNALFEWVDAEIEKDSRLDDEGTTAVVSFIDPKTHLIYTATLGDSEANIYRIVDGQLKSIPISCVRDWSSKADIKRAAKAIEMDRKTAEEKVNQLLSEWRNEGKSDPEKRLRLPVALLRKDDPENATGPNVSRAIGDMFPKKINYHASLKQNKFWESYAHRPIGIKPKITVCQLKLDDLVILACDGLKDFVTESEIVNKLKESHFSSDLQETAKALVTLSTKKHMPGSGRWIAAKGDNVTVSVLRVTESQSKKY